MINKNNNFGLDGTVLFALHPQTFAPQSAGGGVTVICSSADSAEQKLLRRVAQTWSGRA